MTGNPLAVQTKRKIWACYASFVELGSYALQHEESWLCVGLLRSSLMAKAEAGVSQWVSKILRDIFMRPSCPMEHGRISLQRPGGPPVLFRAALSMIVQDGGAHKALWSCKGDAGTRMCMLRRNVIAQRCDILHSSGLPVVGSSEIRESKLSLATNQSIHEAMAKLAEKKLSLNLMLQISARGNKPPDGLITVLPCCNKRIKDGWSGLSHSIATTARIPFWSPVSSGQ